MNEWASPVSVWHKSSSDENTLGFNTSADDLNQDNPVNDKLYERVDL